MYTFLCNYFQHLLSVVSLLYIIKFTRYGTRVAVPRRAAFDRPIACEGRTASRNSLAFGAGKRWTRFITILGRPHTNCVKTGIKT
jgi:hypothetical protein